jgi:hypothetical protein
MLLTLGNIQSLPVIVPEIKIKPGAGAYVTARWGKRGQGEAHRMTAPQNHFIFKHPTFCHDLPSSTTIRKSHDYQINKNSILEQALQHLHSQNDRSNLPNPHHTPWWVFQTPMKERRMR